MKTILTIWACVFWCISVFAQDQNLVSIPSIDSNIISNTQYTEEFPFWRSRRFEFTAGIFFPLNDTEVRVGSVNYDDFGTKINLEDDLGFDKYTISLFANAQWRISKRSRLALDYFYLRRNSVHKLEKDIEFGDHTYPIDARVDAFFNMNILRLYYSYAILAKPKYEVGVLIGAHMLFTDVGISAQSGNIDASFSDSFNALLPVPDVGIWFDIQVFNRVGLYANINYLSLNIDNIGGRIFNTNVFLGYNIYKGLSIKAGYTSLDVRVEATKKRLDGYINWGYNGPTLTLTYAFGNQLTF